MWWCALCSPLCVPGAAPALGLPRGELAVRGQLVPVDCAAVVVRQPIHAEPCPLRVYCVPHGAAGRVI